MQKPSNKSVSRDTLDWILGTFKTISTSAASAKPIQGSATHFRKINTYDKKKSILQSQTYKCY